MANDDEDAEWVRGRTRVGKYLGGVSEMSITRWEADERLDFPQARVINGRRYYSRKELDEWMKRRVGRTKTKATAA
jgi:hypothetical protein